MGSKPGAAIALEYLLNSGWDVSEVVADACDPRCADLISVCTSNNITVVREQASIKAGKVDVVISYMYRKRVTRYVLDKSNLYALNFHPGLLPYFAGYSLYNIAILENAKKYGCTCHVMDDKFDSGPIISSREFRFDNEKTTAFSLERETQIEMLILFYEVIDLITNGTPLQPTKQDKSKARYISANELQKMKVLNTHMSDEQIQLYARAFWFPPYLGAHFKFNNKAIEVVPEYVKSLFEDIFASNQLESLQNISHTRYQREKLTKSSQ